MCGLERLPLSVIPLPLKSGLTNDKQTKKLNQLYLKLSGGEGVPPGKIRARIQNLSPYTLW